MDWRVWAAFAVTEFVLSLTPGPAVLLVISQGLAKGVRASIFANLGILFGNTVYFLASATGLGALLLASYDVFFAIKWAGAAYLVWLGIQALRGKGGAFSVSPADPQPVSRFRLFANGAILQLANPKAILFFAALLPQFIDPAGDVLTQVAILAATSVVLEFLVLLAYGGAAGRLTRFVTRPRFAQQADRVAGGLLIAAGLGMAAIRRG